MQFSASVSRPSLACKSLVATVKINIVTIEDRKNKYLTTRYKNK